MKTSLKNLSPELLEKILDIEVVIIPILAAIGLSLTRDDLKNEMMKDPDQIIVLAFKESQVAALLRYGRFENHLFIKSIVLNPKIGVTALRRLVQVALPVLKEEKVELIESVVQVSNQRSMTMHEKLGFHKLKENPKAIRYGISRIDLINAFMQKY